MNDPYNHDNRLDSIGRIKIDGMTVAELDGLLCQYNYYKQAARNGTHSAYPPLPRAQAQNMPQGASVQPVPQYAAYQAEAPKQGRKFDEISVGRYVMTVAAALLCFLGVAVFMAGFWAALPGIIKYLVVFMAGAGAWALGCYKSKGRMRPFWLGLAGFGACSVFLDVVLGCVLWNLYGIFITGALCLGWTGLCFFMANKRSAWLFYVIAYLGGFATFALSGFVFDSFDGGFSSCIVAIIILAMGAFAWHFGDEHWALVLAWLIGCFVMGVSVKGIGDDNGSPYVCRATCIALACGAGWFLAKAVPGKLKNNGAGQAAMAMLAFLDASFVRHMCGGVFTGCDICSNILAAGILISGCALALPGYVLGAVVPVCFLLFNNGGTAGVLSVSVFGFLLCLGSVKYENKIDRAGLSLGWVACACLSAKFTDAGGISSFSDSVPYAHPAASLLSWLVLAGGLGLWLYLRHKNNDWSAGGASRVCMLCAALYVFIIPCSALGLPDWVFICISALAINAFRRFYIDKYDTGLPAKAGTALLCIAFALSVSIECLNWDVFYREPDMAGRVAMTLSLFLIAFMDAYGMAVSKHKCQGAVACLAANWCLWMAGGLWVPDVNIFISAAGILVSAAFVYAGFRLDNKTARLTGLGCAFLYVLKLGLYDMSFSGGLGMSAGLFVSGAGCFVISFLYNRLGRLSLEKHG